MSHKATNWLASLDPKLLGHSEFRVLFHLCDCHNPANGCFPTQAYLISATGASNGTINNALNALEEKHLIQRHKERCKRSKRQRPTRYVLGFEGIDKPENDQKPSPDIGDGAVSNLEAKPSPISGQSRLQPTGEEPVKEPVINRATAQGASEWSEIAKFWIEKIVGGKTAGCAAIKVDVGAEIRASGLLSEDQLRSAGIAG